ncbi:MAG TPA: hypothetical protein VN329_02720 [Roseomonas sp.]|nr:hypothetical protein [Roseomonas sp.]
MATITGTTGADDIFDGYPLAPTSGDDTIYGDTSIADTMPRPCPPSARPTVSRARSATT